MEAHPQHTAVLEHAASALAAIDPNLALAPARRVVDLNPKCTECRSRLGGLYAMAILGLRRQ